jgi:uncharacterized protein (DUF362 family)
MKSIVSIAHADRVEQGIPQALDQLGDLTSLFQGRQVAIKPNDTWASPRDLTACTQADTVRAAIRYVKRYDPAKITVTGGSGDGETDDIFRLLGIDRVIEEERVEFFDHNRPHFEAVRLEGGPQPMVMVNPHIFEYNTLVSLAQHKVHYAATVTLTMKNIAMSFPAADYYGHPRSEQVHPNSFYRDMQGFIVAMCRRFPIDLGIIVGHPAMTERGPIGGRTFETGLTIASRDFVSTDSVGAYLLGRERVRHIFDAEKIGLGVASLENIQINGVPLEEAAAIFAESAQREQYV